MRGSCLALMPSSTRVPELSQDHSQALPPSFSNEPIRTLQLSSESGQGAVALGVGGGEGRGEELSCSGPHSR